MAETIHASAVAWDRAGLLIVGQSGSGKSSLALALIAYGCQLVSDDRTKLAVNQGVLFADAPTTIAGLVEARGVGILNADRAGQTKLSYVVDLDQEETARLPPRRFITLLGCQIPLILRSQHPHWVPSLLQLLKAGWSDR